MAEHTNWIDEALEHEATLMGRATRYRNAWECIFAKDGEEHKLQVLVYDCAPMEVLGRAFNETRWVIINGESRTGGVV